MVLAQVIRLCEDSMICDLAETYHILNYRELPPLLVATLVLGLGDNSRVKKEISNTKLTLEETILAMILDGINFICWTYTKEAKKGRPYGKKSIFKLLNGEYDKDKDDLESFKTIEEFEEYMKSFIR